MKRRGPRWHRESIGGAGIFVVGAPVLLIVMAMEPTPETLRSTAWILTILGLFVFGGLHARLYYIQARRSARLAEDTPAAKPGYEDRFRAELSVFAWLVLAVMGICGLVWVYSMRAQCFIQGWILGQAVAEGCH